MFYVTLILGVLLVRVEGSVTGCIENTDLKRFLEVLKTNYKLEPEDTSSPYFAVTGYKLLNEQIPEKMRNDVCTHLKQNFKSDSFAEGIFHALSTWNALSCTGNLYTEATIGNLKAVLESDKSTIANIRYSIESLKLIGQTISNQNKVIQTIQNRLKEEEGLINVGHTLHALITLDSANKLPEKPEDVVLQADEVDGKMLQFEGGLSATSAILTGLLRIPNAKPLTQLQADKFAAYLVTRKTVQSPKGIVALLQATKALSESAVSPVSLTIKGPPYVTAEKPDLVVQVSDLFCRPLKTPPTPVIAQSATRVVDDVVVLSKQPLSPGSSPAEFVLSLKLETGQYRVGVSAKSHTAAFTVRVLGPLTVNHLEVGVGDVDGSSVPRLTRLKHPDKLSSALKADGSNQLVVRVSLNRAVHQAFLRLFSENKEIVFIAEPDSNRLYKMEVNLGTELELSGSYHMELIIGDSAISNPIRWNLGSVEAELGGKPSEKSASRGPKPEIEHLFRPAEKRPPQMVSMLFTALAGAPLLLLLVLWIRIGVNCGNFSFVALPFHIGFGSILGLFALFWLKLDMFTTCAWLLPLGGFTFLAGHRLLSRIANQKK